VLRRDEVLQREKPANSAPQRDEPKKTDWTDILPELKLTGMSAGLAQHCAMKSFENDHLTLEVDSKYAAMANEKQQTVADEKNRRQKKIKYGYGVQSSKTFITKIHRNNYPEKTNNKKHEIGQKYTEKCNMEDIKKMELELTQNKFIYDEILKQKEDLETKIKKMENFIKKEKENFDNKYNNTIIYIIRPKHNNFYMYVGHTIDISRRLNEHIRNTEINSNKLYKTIRETGGWEHWEMIELSTHMCRSREDALKIEQKWCEKLRPNLNSVSPFA
jgi:predicted GIY-YIG superfamily endonuclease